MTIFDCVSHSVGAMDVCESFWFCVYPSVILNHILSLVSTKLLWPKITISRTA